MLVSIEESQALKAALVCSFVASALVQCLGVLEVFDFRLFLDFCGDAKCSNPTEYWKKKSSILFAFTSFGFFVNIQL